MNKAILTTLVAVSAAFALGQGRRLVPGKPDPAQDAQARQRAAILDQLKRQEAIAKQQAMERGEQDGVEVRIKDIARFRGIRGNQLIGTGLVVGLAGTGDTRKSTITSEIVSNMFKDLGITIPASQIDMKNVAAVMVTAELPAFSTNGQEIDVTVESLGDAKSLVGGTFCRRASTRRATGRRLCGGARRDHDRRLRRQRRRQLDQQGQVRPGESPAEASSNAARRQRWCTTARCISSSIRPT